MRQTYVLRIVVSAPHDDEILEASADEELAPVEESQVSGAEEGRAIRSRAILALGVHAHGPEVLERLLFISPVAL